MGLMWVPRRQCIENEIDELARRTSRTLFIGPEPTLGFPYLNKDKQSENHTLKDTGEPGKTQIHPETQKK